MGPNKNGCFGKETISCLCLELNYDSLDVQPVA
jgi:hypothetical protein